MNKSEFNQMMEKTFGDRVINIPSTEEKNTIVKDNKLIAEFMGGAVSKDGFRVNIPISDNDSRIFNIYGSPTTFDKGITRIIYLSDIKYHTSWDWLMPVVDKCFQYGELHNSYREQIIASLSGIIDIEDTHKAVVEFIKQLNK